MHAYEYSLNRFGYLFASCFNLSRRSSSCVYSRACVQHCFQCTKPTLHTKLFLTLRHTDPPLAHCVQLTNPTLAHCFQHTKITKVKKGIIYGETFRRILILLRVCGVVHLQSIFDVDEVLQPIANVHGEDFDAWAEKAAEKNADFASTNVEWANVASRGSSRYGRERGELVHTKNTHGRV